MNAEVPKDLLTPDEHCQIIHSSGDMRDFICSHIVRCLNVIKYATQRQVGSESCGISKWRKAGGTISHVDLCS